MKSASVKCPCCNRPGWTPKGRHRVGFVQLWQERDGTWRARFEDTTGKDVRRRLPKGIPVDQALSWANTLNWQLLEQRGFVRQREQRVCGVSVRDAIETAIRLSNGNPAYKKRCALEMNRFLGWLSREHETATEWQMITRTVWREYDRFLKANWPSRDTQLAAWKPLRSAAIHLQDEDAGLYPNTLKAAKIRIKTAGRRNPPTLSAEQLRMWLDWLEANAPSIYPIAVLQGLAGLRIYEAAYLRKIDLDLNAHTVRVADVDDHAVKTVDSKRTIPVCWQAVERLARYLSTRSEPNAPPESRLLTTPKGLPWDRESIMRQYHRAMRKARTAVTEGLVSLPAGFQPHHLRATFTNLARFGAKCDREAVIQYQGRAATDVTAEHYESLPVSQLKALVVSPFEQYLTATLRQNAHGNDKMGGDQDHH